MEGFISKCISVVLIFIMLVIAPMITIYGQHEAQGRMEILNEVTSFLDKVTDKSRIDQEDIDAFTVQIESHGLVLSVTIDRLVKTVTITNVATGEVDTSYIPADDISSISSGDIIKVTVKEISTTPYKKLLKTFLKVDEPAFELSLAKMAR